MDDNLAQSRRRLSPLERGHPWRAGMPAFQLRLDSIRERPAGHGAVQQRSYAGAPVTPSPIESAEAAFPYRLMRKVQRMLFRRAKFLEIQHRVFVSGFPGILEGGLAPVVRQVHIGPVGHHEVDDIEISPFRGATQGQVAFLVG